MSQAVVLAVTIVTVAFLILSFHMDLKERVIYVFPCFMLTLSWGVLGLGNVHDMSFVISIILIHLGVFLFFKFFKVWGDGDTDMFLLYGAVYAAFAIPYLGTIDISIYLLGEVAGMFLALVISLIIGAIEAAIRHTKLKKNSSIAVVPGFVVVMGTLIIAKFVWR